MKIHLLLLTIGFGSTFYFSQFKSNFISPSTSIDVEQVNPERLQSLQNILTTARIESQQPSTVTSTSVVGAEQLNSKVTELFSYLKNQQVLYRYEFFNSMKPFIQQAKTIGPSEVNRFNESFNEAIENNKRTVDGLKFSAQIKQDITARLNEINKPLKLQETTMATGNANSSNVAFITQIENELNNLKQQKTITVAGNQHATYPNPFYLAAIWTGLLLAGAYFSRNRKTVVYEKVVSEEEEKINPTLKRILADLDYPLFMIDQSLNVVWKNKKSEELQLDTQGVQDIFCTRENESPSIQSNGKTYSISFSDLVYKSGKTNYLVQCRPEVVAPRQLEHIVDTSEMAALLEGVSQKGEATFGDLNQTVAHLAVKLGYLFKVSGKYLDIDFKKDLSDCFIEKDRLEKIVKEFIMSCHHMIKDHSETEGIYLRTDESGNKFSVSCFLSNYRVDALNTHPLARDFLRRFSVLEARYAACNPSVDFKVVETGSVKGLDITVNFDNQSELESIISTVSATA